MDMISAVVFIPRKNNLVGVGYRGIRTSAPATLSLPQSLQPKDQSKPADVFKPQANCHCFRLQLIKRHAIRIQNYPNYSESVSISAGSPEHCAPIPNAERAWK